MFFVHLCWSLGLEFPYQGLLKIVGNSFGWLVEIMMRNDGRNLYLEAFVFLSSVGGAEIAAKTQHCGSNDKCIHVFISRCLCPKQLMSEANNQNKATMNEVASGPGHTERKLFNNCFL